jgi:hypothetical protein
MRLGSYYAEGGQARGLSHGGTLAGLDRADLPLPARAAVPPAGATAVG